MRVGNFCAQNGPFPQMRIFFRKPVNEPWFFHSWLSTYQKSKPDINLLVKYWLLKNTEISLDESHFWLQASSFWAVLVHVNEPYKLSIYTNSRQNQWSDFLKKSKNHVFGPFLVICGRWGFFPKNPTLSHITRYGPLTLC